MNLLTSFKILGLTSDTDETQAKRAYKAQVRRWHPDQFPAGSDTKAGAEEQLKQINIAYAQVKRHLAAHGPAATVTAAPTPPGKASPEKGQPRNQQEKKRSWFDHLFSAFASAADKNGKQAASQSAKKESGQPRKNFGQVLNEMAGGSVSAPKGRKSGKRGAVRRGAARYGRSRRRGSGVDAVEGVQHPGPIRPVRRVRGIGRRR